MELQRAQFSAAVSSQHAPGRMHRGHGVTLPGEVCYEQDRVEERARLKQLDSF